MFDKTQFLTCSRNELEELFSKELKGECLGVVIDDNVIDSIVYYKNENILKLDMNILGLDIKDIEEYKKSVPTPNYTFDIPNPTADGFCVMFNVDSIKSFLNKKSYNQLTDDLDFLLDNSGEVVLFEMKQYEPIQPF